MYGMYCTYDEVASRAHVVSFRVISRVAAACGGSGGRLTASAETNRIHKQHPTFVIECTPCGLFTSSYSQQ
jgi:hypothetical protein